MKSIKELKIGVIYKYTSPSGKVYIGQTINEKSRKQGHKKSIDNPKCNTRFKRALIKYGYDNFQYEVIIKFNPTDDLLRLKRVLNKLEERYIKIYNSSHPEFGYNLTTGGESFLHSEESKEKMKENTLNRPEEWREKLSELKKKELEENKEESYIYKNLQKGRIPERETIRQGHSEETKKKMSEVRKNKKSVEQYDLELNLINTFDSIADAARSLEGEATLKTKSSRISECINGKWKSAYNFIWIKK